MRTITMIELDEAQEILDRILEVTLADDGKPVAICIVDAFGDQIVAVGTGEAGEAWNTTGIATASKINPRLRPVGRRRADPFAARRLHPRAVGVSNRT